MTSSTVPLIYVSVVDTSGNVQRITDQTHRVLKLSYTDSEVKVDKCELEVDNYDLSHFDDPIFAHQNRLRVRWGYPGNMSLERELIITKVTGFRSLKVEAKALSVLMATAKRSRTFEGMTRSEIVEQIAAEYGYGADRIFVQQTSSHYEHVTQGRLTDAQFVRKLSKQQGYEFYVDHTGFHWHERMLAQAPVRKFTWFVDKTRSDILDLSIDADITRRPAEVKRVALDPSTGKTTEAAASDAKDKNREGTGALLINKAPDLRSALLVPDDQGTGERLLVAEEPSFGPEGLYVCSDVMMSCDNTPPSVAAKREFRKAQRGSVKIDVDAVGDPSMLAKTVFTLAGVGSRLSGNYYVNEIVHTVDPGAYKMKVKCLSDGTGPFSQTRKPAGEDGLPQVAGNPSNAKRTDDKLPEIEGAQKDDPEALHKMPIYDEDGNITGYEMRKLKSVIMIGGKLVTPEE